MFIFNRSFLLQYGAIFISIGRSDGVCTWPPDFANTSWMDSSKGELLFESETMTGWAFTNGLLTINTWECHTTDYLESHGYLIMKTTGTFILFHTQIYHGYLCMKLTKITDVSYRYYETAPIQSYLDYDRILINDLDTDPPNGLPELCLEAHGATGSEYKLLVKTGFEEAAQVRCPYNILGDYSYTYTQSGSPTTCEGNLDMCSNHKEMVFSQTSSCSTSAVYSVSDTVMCFDSVPVGNNIYVTVYNGLDGSVDNTNTFRFSCMGISGDGTAASVAPQNCRKDQSPVTVPRDNEDKSIGTIMTLPSVSRLCPPCPVLTNPTKGTVSVETNGAVTMATYICLNNYTIAGDATRICQDNDTWSGREPSCTCETPVSPTNGAVTLSSDGVTATYTCIANYTLIGDVTRTCLTDTNTWTGTDPSCNSCDLLDIVVDGDVTVKTNDAGTTSVAIYTCKAGATLNGVTLRTCQTDGTWTDNKPACNSCPSLTTSSSGTVQISTNGISTVANFTCATGYTRFGEQTFNCQTDGTWDAAEPTCVCNPPQAPVNGDLRIPDEYFTAVYTCQTGYTINGPSLRTCQSDGSGWSGDDPICVLCQNTTLTEGLQVTIISNGTVSMANYTCSLKYTMTGSALVTCQETGSWAAETPTCEKCATIPSLDSGSLSYFTDGQTTIAKFGCTTGTTLKGEPVTECRNDGTWSTSTVSCVPCQTLGGLQDGSYTVSSNGTASLVTYSCTEGYTLAGNSQAVCLDNGSWSITDPVCSRDGGSETVTQTDSSLLPAVIVLAVLTALLIGLLAIASFCYYRARKAAQLKHYSMRDEDTPKSIPVAAVPPSSAPVDHQKHMFDGGRSTALSVAPDAHRSFTNRSLLSASSRGTATSISRLNLEMIRETTPSSLYGTYVPAPWSNKTTSIQESNEAPRQESPTLSSLYSSYSSPRRGYSTTPRYFSDTDESIAISPLAVESTARGDIAIDSHEDTPSPTKPPKKRKHKLVNTNIDDDYVPSYMRGTRSSVSKTSADMKGNESRHSSRTTLSVLESEKEQSRSGRSTPKLTTPRD